MISDRDKCKEAAFKILTSNCDQLPQQQPLSETSAKVEAIIGGNLVSFPTYKNPLLVSLYSLLLTWFSIKTYGVPPCPVPETGAESDDDDDILSVD